MKHPKVIALFFVFLVAFEKIFGDRVNGKKFTDHVVRCGEQILGESRRWWFFNAKVADFFLSLWRRFVNYCVLWVQWAPYSSYFSIFWFLSRYVNKYKEMIAMDISRNYLKKKKSWSLMSKNHALRLLFVMDYLSIIIMRAYSHTQWSIPLWAHHMWYWLRWTLKEKKNHLWAKKRHTWLLPYRCLSNFT